MKTKFKPYLERHRYSPEQNTLHLSDRFSVVVGFFELNYNPTFQDALLYAVKSGLIAICTYNEFSENKIDRKLLESQILQHISESKKQRQFQHINIVSLEIELSYCQDKSILGYAERFNIPLTAQIPQS